MSLTSDQFRALVTARGYTLAEVARLWGKTPARLSQIADDPNRSHMYEYALWGLPAKQTAAAITARRQLMAKALSARQATKKQPPDIWHELTEPGSIFTVHTEQGEHLQEGCEGVVIARERRRGELQVLIRFSTGYAEHFALSFLQGSSSFLTATGRRESETPA